MKVIKPQKLGLLTRTFENDHQCFLAATLMAFFPFDEPRALLHEANLWKLVGKETGKDTVFDEAMPKPRGEILVFGDCYNRDGPRPGAAVRVRVARPDVPADKTGPGIIDKKLYVFGDRRWKLTGPTDAEPFERMPVDWPHAFGGEGHAPNPVGKGARAVKIGAQSFTPLPNIEDPAALVRAEGDRPAPAGLRPFDITWPQRARKSGTYDERWLKERYPGFPADLDLGFFNTAPPDQQIEGPFHGDEVITIEGMHPSKAKITTSLPGIVGRCFIHQKGPEGPVFRELRTRLDTLVVFPADERVVAIFRGILPIEEDDAFDVLRIVAGWESQEERKPVEHYRTVMEQRLDKERAHLFALRDNDLMPPEPASRARFSDERPAEMDDFAVRGLLQKNLRNKIVAEMASLETKLREQGIDPTGKIPPLPEEEPLPPLEELGGYVDKAQKEAEEMRKKAEEEARAMDKKIRADLAALGVDYDKLLRDAKKKADRIPRFSADKELERLRDTCELGRNAGTPFVAMEARLADPTFEAKLRALEAQMREAYRRFAHHFEPAVLPDAPEARALREEVISAHSKQESLSGRDLTGADLSGLDLTGVDLSDAMLEGALLGGAVLRGAKLDRAVFARADLSKADLSGASAREANFGAANLTEARLTGADLSSAALAKATIRAADLSGVSLVGADLSNAILHETNLSSIRAKDLLALDLDVSGSDLRGADLSGATWLHPVLERADLSGANLRGAVFVEAKGDGARFTGADMANVRIVKDSSLVGADFSRANLDAANLRETDLTGASFVDASANGAEMSATKLVSAKLDRLKARGASFVRADMTGVTATDADLLDALLSKAILAGADFARANLYRVDLARSRGDDVTSFAGANTKRVRVIPAGASRG